MFNEIRVLVQTDLNQPFSLISRNDATTVAVRDHLGVAPLHYSLRDTGAPVAAPTVDEILEKHPEAGTRIDEAAVVGLLTGPYGIGPEATFFSDIRSVPPGAVMRFAPGAAPEPATWWSPGDIEVEKRWTLGEAATRLREILFEVVADYIPDTPCVCTLSSGMDSTSVLAALAHNNADVTALTWTSHDVPESDESRWAQLTTERIGVPLVELELEAESLLPEEGVVTRRSTPLLNVFDTVWDTTAAQVAAGGKNLVFTGFSGDHLFGGSISPAADMLVAGRLGMLVGYLRARSAGATGLWSVLRSEVASPLLKQLAPGVWAGRRRPPAWLHPARKEQWREQLEESVGPGVRPGRAERLASISNGAIGLVSESVAFGARAHGVELAYPLLDRRLVEFALSLPTWMLNEGQLDKLVLREAMRGILPDEVVELEKILPAAIARRGIRARSKPLLALTRDMRAAELEYVDEAALAEHVAAFMRGDHDDMKFWKALTLEDWLRRWW